MRRIWRRLAVALAAVTIVVGSRAAGDQAPPRLQGTFLQLTSAHASWTDDAWRRLFEYLAALRVTQIVVQWTVHDGTPLYAAAEKILASADRAGMTVLLGLAHDSAFWTEAAREPGRVEVYLRALRAQSERAARDLVRSGVVAHGSFRGWYITEEIEDATWKSPQGQAVLFDHLLALAQGLRRVRPGATVAISGFSNAATSPVTFQRFWTRLLRAAPIDVFLFQDGIGAGKQTLSSVPLYLAAAREATGVNGRELQVIVEVFEQVGAPPQFTAIPARFERVERQLALAAAYSSPRGPIAFSMPEYMTPLAGAAGERLFETYRARVLGGREAPMGGADATHRLEHTD